MTRLFGIALALALGAAFFVATRAAMASPFTVGDLYFASSQNGSRIYDITGGGSFTGAPHFALGGNPTNANLGQMAWSTDHETMYTTNYQGGNVYAVNASGGSSLYVSIPSPLGIVVTHDNRVLVNRYGAGVYDITDPMSVSLFASVPGYARNMRQLPSGEILVAGSNGIVWDVSSGTAIQFAAITGATSSYLGDIEYTSDGRVFVSGGDALRNKIFEITGGGTFSTPFATLVGAPNPGGAFGLAIDPLTDQILVAPLAWNYVLDITAGGAIDASPSSPSRWAYNIPTTNDMALDFVPALVPEPSSLLLATAGFVGLLFAWRRR